jgi:hypothetical protein
MTTPSPLDRQLTDLLGDLADPRYPDYFDDVLEKAMHRPQRPAWTFPERWIPMGVLARRTAFAPSLPWRPIVLMAVLIAVAIAVAAFVGSLRRVPPPFGPAGNGAVAYAAEGDVYLLDIAAGLSRPIVTGADYDVLPLFSRDGTRLAFFRLEEDPEDRATLFISGADGSAPRAVFGPNVIHAMSWSPSGTEIALISGEKKRSLNFVDTDSGTTRTVDMDGLTPWGNVEWLPTPEPQLVFQGLDGGRSAIYSIGADGSGLRALTDWGTTDHFGGPYAISSDGRYLTYTRVGSTVDLHQVDLQSGVDRPFGPRLPEPDDGGSFTIHSGTGVFSPDGKTLVFGRYWDERDGEINHQVWAAKADGDGSDGVAIGPVHRSRGGHNPFWYAYAPDGTTILIAMNEVEETWLADPAGTRLDPVDFGVGPANDPPDWQRTLK